MSFELEEVLALADRILVIYEGEIVHEFSGAEATEEKLGLYMTGGGRAKTAASPATATASGDEGGES